PVNEHLPTEGLLHATPRRPNCFFFFPNSPPSASTGEFPEGFFPVNPPSVPPKPPFNWLPTMPCISGTNFGSEVVPWMKKVMLPPLPPMPASCVSPLTPPPERLAVIL